MFLHIQHFPNSFHFSIINLKNVVIKLKDAPSHCRWKMSLKYNNASLQQNVNKNKLPKLFCHVLRCFRTNVLDEIGTNGAPPPTPKKKNKKCNVPKNCTSNAKFHFPFLSLNVFWIPWKHTNVIVNKGNTPQLERFYMLSNHNRNVQQPQLKSHLQTRSRDFVSCLFRCRVTIKTQNISWQHDWMSVLCHIDDIYDNLSP